MFPLLCSFRLTNTTCKTFSNQLGACLKSMASWMHESAGTAWQVSSRGTVTVIFVAVSQCAMHRILRGNKPQRIPASERQHTPCLPARFARRLEVGSRCPPAIFDLKRIEERFALLTCTAWVDTRFEFVAVLQRSVRTLFTSINFLFTDDAPALGLNPNSEVEENVQKKARRMHLYPLKLCVCLARGVSVGCLNRPPALKASAPQPQHGSFQHHGQAAPSLLLCRELAPPRLRRRRGDTCTCTCTACSSLDSSP
jgi:hypothetical protein